MSALLMAALLAAPGADQPGAMPNVEGKWLIVYAEEGGRRMNSWEQRVANLKDNTLTYERDGKEQQIHLKFGPHQTLKASTAKEDASAGGDGVYIAGQDYLCLSLTSGNFTGGEKAQGAGSSSGSFILILRRQR